MADGVTSHNTSGEDLQLKLIQLRREVVNGFAKFFFFHTKGPVELNHSQFINSLQVVTLEVLDQELSSVRTNSVSIDSNPLVAR